MPAPTSLIRASIGRDAAGRPSVPARGQGDAGSGRGRRRRGPVSARLTQTGLREAVRAHGGAPLLTLLHPGVSATWGGHVI